MVHSLRAPGWCIELVYQLARNLHEQGTPAELFGSPQTPELQQFLSSLHD